MASSDVRVVHFADQYRTPLVELLQSACLPVEGFHPTADSTLVAIDGRGEVVGGIMLVHYGDRALLRSLVVDSGRRQMGVGRALVLAAEWLARRNEVRTLYLLTDTAADFFARLGFAHVRRARVPSMVANDPEFTHLCSTSAAVMRKSFSETDA